MRLTQNMKAISRFPLIILLLTSAIIGALLSYLWVVGYYISMEKVYPENPFVTIKNVKFNPQNTHFFNVTIECPTSYEAKEPANITEILVSTNKSTHIHVVTEADPPLPYQFSNKGELKTFNCTWNWANYTGQTIGVGAVVEEGSRFMSKGVETPFVELGITDIYFNATISVTHFNVTVQNIASPETWNITINIKEISVTAKGITQKITATTPQLPWPLNPGESRNFMCTWYWTKHQNTSVTVSVHTSQGYTNYITERTPPPVTLEITNILFDVTNTTRFDVTVKNNKVSPTHLNVTRITVMIGNQTIREWTMENRTAVDPSLPFMLNKNSSETFVCPWNWTEHRDVLVTVLVYTSQGFAANRIQATPPPIILDITDVTFDPIDTNHFDITIQNSELSLMDTDITEVFVTIENEIVANFTDYLDLPTMLNRTQSVNFTCPWSWEEYVGKNVTIVVETEQDYSVYSEPITLVALTISDAAFSPIQTDYFILTVQNPTLLNFTLTTVKVIIDETSLDVTGNVDPPFPFLLPTGANYTFICKWENWTVHQEKEVTIIIETLHGYRASYKCKIPSAPF